MHTSIILSVVAMLLGIFIIQLWKHFDSLIKSHEIIYPVGKRIHQCLMGIGISKHRDIPVLINIIHQQTNVFREIANVQTTAKKLNITNYRAAAILNCAIPKGACYTWVVIDGNITLKINKALLTTVPAILTA